MSTRPGCASTLPVPETSPENPPGCRRQPMVLAGVLLLAVSLVGGNFLLQGRLGLNLGDEGFLWEGVERTLHGDVPIRDFNAYDPGRYYWAAVWAYVFGDGLLALRLSTALFQVLGLFCGLLAARRVVTHPILLVLVGLLLLAWMFPRHKLFEASIALIAVHGAVRLLERPTARRCFQMGLLVGAAAVLGRNHGLYTLLALAGLSVLLYCKRAETSWDWRPSWGLGGMVLGYSPMLFMLLAVPGFARAFMDSLDVLAQRRSTNIALPIPWPWSVDYASLDGLGAASACALGLCYVLLPPFYGVVVLAAWWTRPGQMPRRALLIAAGFVGLGYLHHAWVRADLWHLAQGIHPFLLGLVALLAAAAARSKVAAAVASIGLFALTFLAAGPGNYLWQRARATDPQARFIACRIGGDRFWLARCQAEYIATVREFIARQVAPGEGLLIAPFEPGLYPVLGRRSLLWNAYFLFREREDCQQHMVSELQRQKVRWALVSDATVDGKGEFGFRQTHELVWKYLENHYRPVTGIDLPPGYHLLQEIPAGSTPG